MVLFNHLYFRVFFARYFIRKQIEYNMDLPINELTIFVSGTKGITYDNGMLIYIIRNEEKERKGKKN